MFAFVLAVAILASWWVVGLAVFRFARPALTRRAELLMAPAFGLSLHVVAIFTLSRLDLPIATFAAILAAGMGAIAIVGFAWRRRVRPVRGWIPFALVGVAAIALSGWPLFAYGFEWLGFVNGDSNTYAMSGERLRLHGFFELPDLAAMVGGTDATQKYWFFQNIVGHRAGAEMLLAFIVAVTGLSAHQVYMPLILAMHATLVVGMGALVAVHVQSGRAPLLACVLGAASALSTLGVAYQLLAQVAGLAMLVLCCAALAAFRDGRFAARRAAVFAFAVAALLVTYPEVAPFFALFAAVHEGACSLRSRHFASQRWALFMLAALGAAGILNTYALDAVEFVRLSFTNSGEKAAMVTLFPYYFLPGGLASLWGWAEFNSVAQGGYHDAKVLLAAVATLVLASASVALAWRGRAAAQMTAVMLAVAAYLFATRNGFGLFKLAMFVQPFLAATLVLAVARYLPRPAHGAAVGVAAIAMLATQHAYVKKSTGERAGVTRVPFATPERMGARLREFADSARSRPGSRVFSDASIHELNHMQKAHFRGVALRNIVFEGVPEIPFPPVLFSPAKRDALVAAFGRPLTEEDFLPPGGVGILPFPLAGPDGVTARNEIKFEPRDPRPGDWLLGQGSRVSILNRAKGPERMFLAPYAEVRNHLVFRSSPLGTSMLNVDARAQALGDLESDIVLGEGTMAAIGRYHVYEVLNPMPESSLRLAVTASVNRRDDFVLPPVMINGESLVRLPLVGRGSARVTSGPVAPRKLEPGHFLGLDFGRDGTAIDEPSRSPVMQLYGSEVPLDRRRVVGFARDISFVSSTQPGPAAPSSISRFPHDLADPGLEYSGVFEDGWIAEAAYFRLADPEGQAGTRRVVVKGMIPSVDDPAFTTEITVAVDGRAAQRRTLGTGEFELAIPVGEPANEGRRKIDLTFSKLQRLPGGDGRPVSILIRQVAIAAAKD